MGLGTWDLGLDGGAPIVSPIQYQRFVAEVPPPSEAAGKRHRSIVAKLSTFVDGSPSSAPIDSDLTQTVA